MNEYNEDYYPGRGKTKRFLGYLREEDKTLSMCDVELIDGDLFCGNMQWEPTGETAILVGWPDEGKCVVYINDGGRELLIPTIRIGG